MEAAFWHQRWQDDRVGFHQAAINPQLERYWPTLGVARHEQVFVPLCGKSRDMLWLSARHSVLGVELSPIAVQAFFREAGLEPGCREEGAFLSCETERLRVLCGDFFQLVPEQLEDVRAVYDRASLIALPEDMRRRFSSRLTELLPVDVAMLLLTLEYPQTEMPGPPFSVTQAEIRELFEPGWSVEWLHEEDVLAAHARFRQRGLSRLSESVYRLKRRLT